MSASIRSLLLLLLAAALLLPVAACSGGTGPLGTPSSPAVSPASTDEPLPTDVAPASPSDPLASATPEPATAPPTVAPSASPAATTAPATAAPTIKPTPKPTAEATMVVRAYFVLGSFTDNGGLVPVLRTIPETKGVARAAMTALLAGPKGVELEASPAMYTGIPEGTRLLDIAIADGTATVDLSGEYRAAKANFQGATAAAQVVYTLTQFPTVKRVRIEVEGESQGGALDRSDFQHQGILPAIFVDRPAWGAAAGNPVRLSGIANVFEAVFKAEILNARGDTVGAQTVTATCGTGCWGSFKASVPYSVGKAQWGTLRVYEPSAKDGSPINVTEYRVWLTP